MQKTLDDSPEQVYNSTRKVTETLKNQRRNKDGRNTSVLHRKMARQSAPLRRSICGCAYIKQEGRLNELLGSILVVSPCCRLHGANLCKQLGGADRGSTAGLVATSP